jgi:ubiquinone/menaquinone biosynthesis C-methylase UbiE
MKKVSFLLGKYKIIGNNRVWYDTSQRVGIKKEKGLSLVMKQIAWPFYSLLSFFIIDGFIEREIGKLIKKYLKHNDIFLEIGCGDMNLKRYIPRNMWYNAFDVLLSDFHLKRSFRERYKINIALASAEKIPLKDNSVSFAVSTETLEHIRNINKALLEISRVLQKDGYFVVSIPNNYCYKYQKKGPHEDHLNNWTFRGFIEMMKKYNFKLMKGFMKGYWIPLPNWITSWSFQLPIRSKEEKFNTNFFYVFQKND